MNLDTYTLLKDLTGADAPSGYEKEAREVLAGYLKAAGELSTDKLGSLICRQQGSAVAPKIMLAAHMDEIGFMVKNITSGGFIKFLPLGGWFSQVLPAKRVKVKTARGPIPGVIGSKPPHLMTAGDQKKPLAMEDLFIDIGAGSRKEAERFGVRPGDPIVPVFEFTVLKNPDLLAGKAFDNRAGCAVLTKVLHKLKKEKHPNTVYGTATVQEEVGLRGAHTAAFEVAPDAAIILECRIANDFPGVDAQDIYSRMGKGPQITFHDPGMIPNRKFRDLVVKTAKEENIPCQIYAVNTGGTDAGVVHKSRSGVPSIVIGVPVRYFHSHAGILRRSDFEQVVSLVTEVVKRMDDAVVSGFTE